MTRSSERADEMLERDPDEEVRGRRIQVLAAAYDEHAGLAFALALRIAGDVAIAERAVEQAFSALARSSWMTDGSAPAGRRLRAVAGQAALDLLREAATAAPRIALMPGRTDVAARLGIAVHSFPGTDTAFRAHVILAVASDGVRALAEAQDVLRIPYPNARLVRSKHLSELVPGDERIYAYRDGSIAAQAEATSWWQDRALARTTLSADHRYVDANEAASALFGVAHDGIVGVPAGSFTRHETDPRIGPQVFASLDLAGGVTSTAVVRRPDGREIAIDFHTELDGDRHVTTMRERVAG